jgi:hypothetical protein
MKIEIETGEGLSMQEEVMEIGDEVIYKDRRYEVLGYAASEDDQGNKLIEIAWDDYNISPTGYLAVKKSDLLPFIGHCPRCSSYSIKSLGGVSGQQERWGLLIDVDVETFECQDCKEQWSD